MANEQEVQEKYVLLQMIENQMKQIEQDVQGIMQKNQELVQMKGHLDNLGQTKENSKMKAPVGAGIYVDAEIKATQEVFVNMGAGILVKKTIKEAQETIDKQMVEAQKAVEQLSKNIEVLATKGQETQHELQHLMGNKHEH